ncbi:hypothetical protein [Flavobacterium sp.]|uniref:hypothetical protein n=1 Tax=Flavobacterium sp. TaxID=239 RepID=UPI00286D9C21|nr:hypothetical protein [Flavobacterium sp.]
MKKIIFIAINIFTISISFGQNFEGKIIYSNTCTSNIPNITSASLSSLIGSKQEYIIKDNNYKSISNGTLFEWQLYINISSKLYIKATSSETIFCSDDKKQDDEIISVKLNKNTTKVLDYNCDELVIKYNTKVQKYYFDSEIKVDSKLFENHKFIDWYGNLLKANLLPLKIITESFGFTNETIATKIIPLKIEDKTFELPKGIKIEEK